MPRPKRNRCVSGNPTVTYFKPRGVPMSTLARVVLTLDEFEALRLADFEQQYHEEAASQMKVSRATFGRILGSAHQKVADALVHGKAMLIEHGPGVLRIAAVKCEACGFMWEVSSETERAICPSCGQATGLTKKGEE